MTVPDSPLGRSALAPAFKDAGIVAVDIGARGGILPALRPIAFAVDAIGFEPDPEAFTRLVAAGSGPWRSVRYLPTAVAGAAGKRTLRVPSDPAGASLLEPLADWPLRLNKPQFFDCRRAVEVECRTLDDALDEVDVSPTFLKLDVEGAEMEILAAAPMALEVVVAVMLEVAFLPLRDGQVLASEVDAFMRARGFVMLDLFDVARWRRDGVVLPPHADRSAVPYARGQMVHGDALYVRDMKAGPDVEPDAALKLAAVLLAFGFFDHANALLKSEPVAAALLRRHGLSPAAVAAAVADASRFAGRRGWRRAFADHLRGLAGFVRSAARLWP